MKEQHLWQLLEGLGHQFVTDGSFAAGGLHIVTLDDRKLSDAHARRALV